jgi:hypothetical protein
LMMPRSIALRRRDPAIMLHRVHNYRWRFDVAEAIRAMAIWTNGRRAGHPFPLRLKATPTTHHTRTPVPTPGNSRANTRTGPSRAALGTICPRKPRRPSPKRSSTSQKVDRRQRLDFGIRTYKGEIVPIANAPGPCPRRSTETCFLRHHAT